MARQMGGGYVVRDFPVLAWPRVNTLTGVLRQKGVDFSWSQFLAVRTLRQEEPLREASTENSPVMTVLANAKGAGTAVPRPDGKPLGSRDKSLNMKPPESWELN